MSLFSRNSQSNGKDKPWISLILKNMFSPFKSAEITMHLTTGGVDSLIG